MLGKNGESGFSLIDLLVAAAIIGIGLVGITRAYPIALKAQAQNERRVKSSLLGHSVAAYIKDKGFQAVGTTENGDFSTGVLDLEGYDGWTWNYEIKSVDDGTADAIVRYADITISFGAIYSDQYSTIILNDSFNP